MSVSGRKHSWARHGSTRPKVAIGAAADRYHRVRLSAALLAGPCRPKIELYQGEGLVQGALRINRLTGPKGPPVKQLATKGEIMDELVIGVVSGLVASFIVFVLHKLYLSVIRPWIEDRVYKDARIEGRWCISYPEMSEVEEQVTLERSAHKVTGQINCTKGPDAGKIYDVEGTFRNLLLTLTYASADRSALDRGAFVLQLNGNGGSFCGHSSYYYNQDHSIVGAACEWRRIAG